MKKSMIFFIVVSLISSQIQSCSQGKAIVATVLVGAASMANVYRVNDSYSILSENVAIGLGLITTIGTGCFLYTLTPGGRFKSARSLLNVVNENPLLKHHHLVKTPAFVQAVQSEYVTAGLPYAEAFSRLKNDKMHVDNAMATMNKARNIENNPGFGQDVVSQLMNRDQILKELMLEVKSHPEFQSQYTKDKKIKAGEEVADAAQTVATAQMFQATNSFFHPRQ